MSVEATADNIEETRRRPLWMRSALVMVTTLNWLHQGFRWDAFHCHVRVSRAMPPRDAH